MAETPPFSFTLTKVNKSGKKQARTLTLTEDGVASASESQTRWQKPRALTHALHLSRTDQNSFVISFLEPYKFETDDPREVKQVLEAWETLKLGQVFYNDEFMQQPVDDDGKVTPPMISAAPSSVAATESHVEPTTQQGGVATKRNPQPIPTDDNVQYASSTFMSPTAQNRFERPPKFPEPPPSAPQLMKPENFELVASVGKGSFGQVFLVRRVDDNRFFAMKVLKKRAVIDRKQLVHLRAEHMILQTVSSPFCVRLYHSFETRTRLFFILDFALGGEMFHHLKKNGQFTEETAVFYLAEAVSAFDYLHEYDIVFRDTKPENLLLDGYGHVMLTDFGLAKCGVSADSTESEGFSTQTFCGTPDYLSAEVVASVPHGKAVDVWSVGALLYEMLVGEAPFSFGNQPGQQPNRSELYKRILRGHIIFPPNISAEARDFVLKCTRRRPKERPTMSDLKSHPIFEKNGIDWEKLQRKEIPPPKAPKINENCVKAVEGRLQINGGDSIYKYVMPDNLVQHFDPRFTQEPPTLAPSTPEDAVTPDEDKNFKEFNWTAQYAFDKVREK